VIVERIERMRNKNRVMGRERERMPGFSHQTVTITYSAPSLCKQTGSWAETLAQNKTQSARPVTWLYAKQQQNTLMHCMHK